MNLRARETVYWPGISEDIKVTYQRCDICAKFARTVAKGDAAVCWNTPIWMETTLFRHFLIEKHTLSSNSWLLQSVPHHQKTAKSPLSECDQTYHGNLRMEIGVPRCIVSDGGMYSSHHKSSKTSWKCGVSSTESPQPPMCSLMARQNVLYRLSRIVSPKPWKEGKIYT